MESDLKNNEELAASGAADPPARRPRTARYDKKLNKVLTVSSTLFAEKGYDRASIRDVSRAARMSLSGLYYYFNSKEELLYLIQYRTFESLCTRLREIIDRDEEPEVCLQAMIRMHFDYFIRNMNDLLICSRDIESLEGEFFRTVAEKRKEYFDLTQSIFDRILETADGEPAADSRLAALYLFGTLNWIYQWYRPGRDPEAAEMAGQLAGIYLQGFPRAGKAVGR